MPSSKGIGKKPLRVKIDMVLRQLMAPDEEQDKAYLSFLVSSVNCPPFTPYISSNALKLLTTCQKQFVRKPAWSDDGSIKTEHYRCYAMSKKDKKTFPLTTIEHPVPNNMLCNYLIECRAKNKLSKNKVKNILSSQPTVAIVTLDEDKLLTSAGLRDRMPDKEYDLLSGDPWSRYKEVGIHVIDLRTRKAVC